MNETRTAAQSRTTRSPWVARRAAQLWFLVSACLTLAVSPWTLVIATGEWGHEFNASDVPTLLVGVVLFVSTWASYMACYFTHRKA